MTTPNGGHDDRSAADAAKGLAGVSAVPGRRGSYVVGATLVLIAAIAGAAIEFAFEPVARYVDRRSIATLRMSRCFLVGKKIDFFADRAFDLNEYLVVDGDHILTLFHDEQLQADIYEHFGIQTGRIEWQLPQNVDPVSCPPKDVKPRPGPVHTKRLKARYAGANP